jgi:hypothetical protein
MDDQVDFTVVNSVREVLGFDSRLAPLVGQAAGWNEFSDGPASFNRVNSYLLTTNLISDGVPTNNTAAGILANVPITAAPGSQINYAPQTPTRVNANELIGASKLNFRFSLLDQELRPTNTQGEVWTLLLTIRYNVLLTGEKVPLMSI